LLAASAGSGKALFGELADRAVEEALNAAGCAEPRTAAAFETTIEAARGLVTDRGTELVRTAKSVLLALKDARVALEALGAPAFAGPRAAIARQVTALVGPGWLRETPDPWLRQLPKYLRAAARRAERLADDIERDRRLEAQVLPYEAALRDLVREGDPGLPSPERERLRWMIEEFRVSLFAQELRTLLPVSAKRLDQQLRLARGQQGTFS
jgi:ATP-dependent helicase HrpA